MIRRIISLILVAAMPVNQAVMCFAHAHRDSSQPAEPARLHLHLGDHSHDHHHHDADHHHDVGQHLHPEDGLTAANLDSDTSLVSPVAHDNFVVCFDQSMFVRGLCQPLLADWQPAPGRFLAPVDEPEPRITFDPARWPPVGSFLRYWCAIHLQVRAFLI